MGKTAEHDLDAALADVRAQHNDARASIAVIEAKAARLLTPTVGLLTGTVAVTAFQLKATADARTWPGAVLPIVGALAGVVATLYLVTAVVRALDADIRMGLYRGSTAETRLEGSRAALAAEALGTALASWTRQHKATRLIWARAALSRAIVALTVALTFGGLTTLTRTSPGPRTDPQPTVSAPATRPASPPAPTTTQNPTSRPPTGTPIPSPSRT